MSTPLPAALLAFDRATRVTPFGARFVDPANGKAVHDGLQVSVYPSSRPDLRRDAYVTAGGVFALQSVPGLGGFAHGDGQRAFWESALAAPKPFVVEVRDALGRFMDMSLRITLPTPGPFDPDPSATGLPPAVALLGTAARRAPPSVAVVRADLRDARQPESTALKHALLVVSCAGQEVGSGIADELGRVAVMFNLPEPPAASRFEWPVAVQMYCAQPRKGIVDDALPAAPPDRAALRGQRSGTPWRLYGDWNQDTSTGSTFEVPPLRLGHELVLKTTGWTSLLATPA